ncbi:MAG: hypothetical protein KGY50_03740, partial [Candidatus Thermoplasmatota archaeon]|nr:hypothetical protein [Candidatus Thermoplasmatota archaeon]
MKKRYQKQIGMLITLTIIGMLSFSTIAVSESSSQDKKDYNNSLEYTFSFTEPTCSQIRLYGQDFTRVSMKGTLLTGRKVGGPQIPAKPVSILLPQGTTYEDISISVSEKKAVDLSAYEISLKDYPIAPYQPSIPLGSPRPDSLIMNQNVYDNTQRVPETSFDFVKTGYSRGYSILSLTLYPTEYNPKVGSFFYYPEMSIT